MDDECVCKKTLIRNNKSKKEKVVIYKLYPSFINESLNFDFFFKNKNQTKTHIYLDLYALEFTDYK